MMAMNLEKAGQDMGGAVDLVRDRATVDGIGVVGFCMGGGLAMLLATQRPDVIKACVPFYGIIPWQAAQPDWSALEAAVQGHYAAEDGMAPPDTVRALEQQLRDLGKDVEMFIYPGTDHAFFNDTRPEVHDPEASAQAWERTISFFRTQLA